MASCACMCASIDICCCNCGFEAWAYVEHASTVFLCSDSAAAEIKLDSSLISRTGGVGVFSETVACVCRETRESREEGGLKEQSANRSGKDPRLDVVLQMELRVECRLDRAELFLREPPLALELSLKSLRTEFWVVVETLLLRLCLSLLP